MNYYLFRLGNHYRIEKAASVQEACRLAFGVVYDKDSNVRYKNVGTRSPKYVSQKIQSEWYKDEGWLQMP